MSRSTSEGSSTAARASHTLYDYAWFLGHRLRATHVVGIGRVEPEVLVTAYPGLEIVGILPPRSKLPSAPGSWMSWDGISDSVLPSPPDLPIVLCLGLSWLDDPERLLHRLRAWSSRAAAVIVTEEAGQGRASSPEALGAVLKDAGLDPNFLGWTTDGERRVSACVVAPTVTPRMPVGTAPDIFRVTSIMVAYNEEDIIAASLDRLIEQKIDVHVIDNWSTDGTYAIAADRLGRGVTGIERYPPAGPSTEYRWRALIRRVEEVAATSSADWIMHHDVDEVRMPPWPQVGLRDAIHAVDQLGFNAIDHTVLLFQPTDDGFTPGTDFASHLRHFEFASARDLLQIKAWKRTAAGTASREGGHDFRFPGRHVYPFKFLTRHYPIRSQVHGERKVFGERKPRFKEAERSLGWHHQYEHFHKGVSFLGSKSELHEWDDASFVHDHLLEALCGAPPDRGLKGLVGNLVALLPGGYDVRRDRKRGSDGVEYDCVEYDRGDVIYRHGSHDLASREAAILSRLDGAEFPRLLAERATDEYSLAILERPLGRPVQTQAANVTSGPERFHRFVSECLVILAKLRQASVTHRNITDSTLLIRESGLFLGDFTWAGCPFVRDLDFEPLDNVPPEGTPCDIYAMGKVLAGINASAYPEFNSVLSLMTESDPSIRVTDVDELQALFDTAFNASAVAS